LLTSPELLDAVVRVGNRVDVLGEAGGGYEVVNLAVTVDDFLDAAGDRVGVTDCFVLAMACAKRMECTHHHSSDLLQAVLCS